MSAETIGRSELGRHLMKQWAQAQRIELFRLNFPSVSPMFRDYVAGYRSSSVGDDLDVVSERVGQALAQMKPGLSNALKLRYLSEGRISATLHDIAINQLVIEYESLPVDHNP